MGLNEVFKEYLEEAIGKANSLVAFSAFERPASSSVRINPFKSGPVPEGREVSWNRHGRILAQRPVFTLDPSFHGGAYYVQDSSSMFVGHVFRQFVKSAVADSYATFTGWLIGKFQTGKVSNFAYPAFMPRLWSW